MEKPVEMFPMDAACLTLPAIITLLTTSASVGFRSFNNADASSGLKDFNDAGALGGLKDFNDAGAAPGLAVSARKRPPASIFIHYSQSTASNPCPISIRHRQLTASIGHSPKKAQNTSAVQGAGVLLEVI